MRSSLLPGPTVLVLGCLLACGETELTEVALSATVDATDGHRTLLVPDEPQALVGSTFRLTFRDAGSVRGDAATRIVDSFDPFMARVGGQQWNVLDPDVVAGRAGLSLVLPEAGHGMVGYSTAPRRIRVGSETVRFSQHVKTLFSVVHKAGDVPGSSMRPVSSASLSYRFGLRLEIVPMLDPLPLLPGAELPLQVRFEGPELGGAVVAFSRWSENDESTENTTGELFHAETDESGTVVVPVQRAGRYLATVEHTSRDGEVLWSALTFRVGAN